jgi:hypothetical protein
MRHISVTHPLQIYVAVRALIWQLVVLTEIKGSLENQHSTKRKALLNNTNSGSESAKMQFVHSAFDTDA